MLLSTLLAAALADAPAWPDLSAPPRVGGGSRDAAIIVSIEDYVFVDDIPGAQANGLDWYSYLTDGRGISPSRVTLLENQRATREAISDAIAESRARVGADGTLWFVFIGHGAPSRDGSDGLLLGADTQPTAASVYARGLPQSELLAALNKGAQAETVVLLDACFSGQASGGALVEGLMPLVPDYGAHKSKAIVLSAGKGDEFAGPLPGAARPAFSYLALGALRGWGDTDGNGQLTAQEVSDYARGALQAMPLDHKQTPQIHADAPSTVLGSGRESGPSLSQLRRSLSDAIGDVTVSSGGSELARQLAEMQRLQQQQAALEAEQARIQAQLDQEVASQRAALQAEAAARWSEAKAITGEMRPQALQLFIDAYEDAHFSIGSEHFPVEVAEVADAALELARIYNRARDYDRALPLYADACTRQHADACNALANLYYNGRAGAPDYGQAMAHYRKACALKHAYGCRNVGYLYEYEKGVAQDYAQAMQYYVLGCELGNPNACFSIGSMYLDGDGVEPDHAQARRRFQEACDQDEAIACNELGYLYDSGTGGLSQDYAQALALYERACALGNNVGCYNTGYFYEMGRVRKDLGEASRAYAKGCELGYEKACTRAADLK